MEEMVEGTEAWMRLYVEITYPDGEHHSLPMAMNKENQVMKAETPVDQKYITGDYVLGKIVASGG